MTINKITKSPTPVELLHKVNELVEGVNVGCKSGARIPVGHVYTIGYSELDAGQLPLLGGEYSRTTYADLWTWVQSKPSLLKTEAQWQTLKTASGNKGVPYYSAGNGTTTFRVPMFGCYVKGSTNIGDVGGFLAAGLPNAVGAYSGNIGEDGSNASGAFSVANQRPHGAWQGAITMNRLNDIYLSLAKSNPIFGNSDTVQPDSIIQLYVVQAFGEVTNVGSTDVAAIAVGLQELETNKMNADCSNAIRPYVLESWINPNKNEGYEIMSNGKIMQWGYFVSTVNDVLMTVNFHIPFKYIPCVCASFHYGSSGIAQYQYFCPRNVSRTNFQLMQSISPGYSMQSWFAIGIKE